MLRTMLVLLVAAPALRADGAVQAEHVEAELIARETSVKPGRDVEVAVRFRLDEHWYLYWRNPGDAGEPPRVRWKLPGGTAMSRLRWPSPGRVPIGPITCYGYSDELVLAATLKVPPGYSDDTLRIGAQVSWLACADVCIGGEAELALELPVRTSEPMPDERWTDLFRRATEALPRPAGDAVRVELRGGSLRLRWSGEVAGSAYFFAADAGVVDAAAEQAVECAEDELVLTLARAEPEGPPPDRLRGVLVVGDRSFAVDAAIGRPAAASGMPAAFIAGGVALATLVAFAACRFFYCRP